LTFLLFILLFFFFKKKKILTLYILIEIEFILIIISNCSLFSQEGSLLSYATNKYNNVGSPVFNSLNDPSEPSKVIAAISSNVWSVYKNSCSFWFVNQQNQAQAQDDSLNMIFLDCEVIDF